MSNFSKSVVRTIVPLVVGTVVATAAKAGWHITSATTTVVLAPVISAAYYFLVRLIEEKLPKAGILLGVPTKPQYDVKAAVVAAEKTVAPAATAAQVTIADELTKIALPNVTSNPVVAETVAPVVAATAPAVESELKKVEKVVVKEVKKVEEKLAGTRAAAAKKAATKKAAPTTPAKKNTK